MSFKYRLVLLAFAMLAFAPAADAGYLRGKHYTLDEIYAHIRELGNKSDIVSIEEIGKSVEGRPILAVRIARRDGTQRPEALITSSIHAIEFSGDRIALAVAEKLIEKESSDPWVASLLDRMDFYIVPLMNPDGYARASRRLDRGFTSRRTNADGVDLNRNFPYPAGVKPKNSMAGSSSKLSPNYHGPFPLSAPENIALDKLAQWHKFFVAINFHTTGGHFLFPWGYKTGTCPNQDYFQEMGKAFNERQNKCKYVVQPAIEWYQTVGDLDDWLYGRYGALSVTVEVARNDIRLANPIRFVNPFWWYNPTKIEDWIENDRDAAMSSIEAAFELTKGIPLPPQDITWVLPEGYEGK